MSLWAVGSHRGLEQERALGRQWPKELVGSIANGPWSPAFPLSPRAHSQQPSPLLVLLGLPRPTGHEGLAPALVTRAGLWSREETLRARSQVPGHRPWAQQLRLGLAPGPVSLGTELIEEKCSPGPRLPAGAGERARAHPYPHHIGSCVAAHCKAVGMVAPDYPVP